MFKRENELQYIILTIIDNEISYLDFYFTLIAEYIIINKNAVFAVFVYKTTVYEKYLLQ